MSKYLNVILTVNAVLLTALVWTQVAERPVLSSEAQALNPPPNKPVFLVDPGQQQEVIIELLGEIRDEVAGTQDLLRSGDIKVRTIDPKANVTRNPRPRIR